MNLVYFIPSLSNPGGMERILIEKVNYLVDEYDWFITIVTTEGTGDPYYNLNPKIRVIHLVINFDEYFHRSVLVKLVKRRFKLLKYREEVKKILKAVNYNWVVSMGGKELLFLPSIVEKSKIIVEVHFSRNYFKFFANNHYKSKFYRLIGIYNQFNFERSLKDVYRFVVLTKADLIDWRKDFDNVLYIPNFTNCHSSNLYNNSSKKIISVGRLDEQKGYDILIRVWANVISKISDWEVHIYGEGPMRAYLEKKICDYGLTESFILKGTNAMLSDVYRNYSFFVCPSRYEGFSISILEAISNKLPVISFNCPHGPADLVKHNSSGFLIEDFDEFVFSEHIKKIVLDDSLRSSMSDSSYKHSLLFTQDKIMPNWFELFSLSKN